MPDAGSWLLDAGCWMLVNGNKKMLFLKKM